MLYSSLYFLHQQGFYVVGNCNLFVKKKMLFFSVSSMDEINVNSGRYSVRYMSVNRSHVVVKLNFRQYIRLYIYWLVLVMPQKNIFSSDLTKSYRCLILFVIFCMMYRRKVLLFIILVFFTYLKYYKCMNISLKCHLTRA